MTQINLLAIPNQSFKYQAEEELFDIEIKTTKKATFITISRDDITLISNQLIIPNTLILQYDYQVTNGNFIFSTMNNNYPDYEKFNVSQFLYYATNEEIENG